nr:hypothetical protein [Nannocystis sp.]
MMLIEAAQQFPTVVFTIGLGICLIYWLFVLIGALDIDMFGDADISGAGKALGGGGHDIGDVAGAGKAIGHGGDHDLDVDGGGGLWSGLGLAKVPITISVSVIFLVCWCISLLAMHYLPDVIGPASWLGPTILPATLIVGLPIAGLLVRPLGGVFELREGKSNQDYVGHSVTVTTGTVDDGFGQGMVEDGGTVLVIPIRCDKAGLSRNDKALIIDFDTERQAYVVEPVTDMLLASPREGDTGQSA